LPGSIGQALAVSQHWRFAVVPFAMQIRSHRWSDQESFAFVALSIRRCIDCGPPTWTTISEVQKKRSAVALWRPHGHSDLQIEARSTWNPEASSQTFDVYDVGYVYREFDSGSGGARIVLTF
jgi:hypothetical protein